MPLHGWLLLLLLLLLLSACLMLGVQVGRHSQSCGSQL
jgi:hypothetical protein